MVHFVFQTQTRCHDVSESEKKTKTDFQGNEDLNQQTEQHNGDQRRVRELIRLTRVCSKESVQVCHAAHD